MLRECLRHPAEDAPRHALADHLEENGFMPALLLPALRGPGQWAIPGDRIVWSFDHHSWIRSIMGDPEAGRPFLQARGPLSLRINFGPNTMGHKCATRGCKNEKTLEVLEDRLLCWEHRMQFTAAPPVSATVTISEQVMGMARSFGSMGGTLPPDWVRMQLDIPPPDDQPEAMF